MDPWLHKCIIVICGEYGVLARNRLRVTADIFRRFFDEQADGGKVCPVNMLEHTEGSVQQGDIRTEVYCTGAHPPILWLQCLASV